jgi:hypothetical protein
MADTPDFLRGALAIADAASSGTTPSSSLAGRPRASGSRTLDGRIRKARKPKEGCHIIPSVFRPHVFASDRLGLWKTPHGQLYTDSIEQYLPKSVCTLLFNVSLSSLEEKTRSNYGAGLLRFTQFCDAFNIPEELRMPAPEWLLAAFTAVAAGSISRSCIDGWLSGISFWHSVNGAKWNGDNQLRIAKAAVSKLVPESSKKEKRLPVTLERMLALLEGLDLSNSLDAAIWACATTLFKGVCRGGEFLVPSRGTFDPRYHVARGTTIKWGKLATGLEWLNIRIPWTKTTHGDGALITLTACDEVTNPLPPIRHHLRVNANVPDTAPFFSFTTADGWEPLTKDWFIDRCNTVWKDAGFEDKLLIHGFRIGGATEMLLRGTPPDIVMVQGRWLSTRSFVLYWRKIENILPLFLSRSFVMDRMTRLDASMKDFCARYQH